MKCENCGAELPINAKFCVNCGSKVMRSIICPNCGIELDSSAKFCPECGHNLGILAENDSYEYDNSDCKDESDEDYNSYDAESTEDKIKTIVEKYLYDIDKDFHHYGAEALASPFNSKVLNNVTSKIVTDTMAYNIIGFVDTSIMSNGKSGLAFTVDAIYEKTMGLVIKVPYSGINTLTIKSNILYFNNTAGKGYGNGLNAVGDISIVCSSFYNAEPLKKCLEEIVALL